MTPVALPHDDPNPAQRALRLRDARSAWTYGTWNDLHTFADKPPARELPLIGWLVRVLPGVGLVALNDGLHSLFRCVGLAHWTPHARFAPRRPAPSRPTLEGKPAAPCSDSKGGMVARAERGARLMVFNWLDKRLSKTLGDYGTTAKSAPSPAVTGASLPSPGRTLADFSAVYRALPTPSVVTGWERPQGGLTDERFAWLRLAGPNPEMLERIDGVPPGFPPDLAVPGAGTAGDAARDGRLFQADYALLGALVPSVWHGLSRSVAAPCALFAVNDAGALVPVAIRCVSDGQVFRPGEPAWPAAKHVVQVADANQHELVAHLSRTHLLVEIFLMATRTQLASNHPIARLLIPHFEGTVFINYQARTSLIAPGGAIDRIFGGTIASSQQVAVDALRALDIAHYGLPERTKARRTDAIPVYPWRDDALRIWDAVATFVRGVVDAAYVTDAAVAADPELAAWSATLAGPFGSGGVPGFVGPGTRRELADILTLVVYTASAQHAAVNFAQFPLMSFSPLFGGAGWAPAPVNPNTNGSLIAFLPPRQLALQQADTLYLLSSVHYTQLGRYERGWFGDRGVDGLVAAFRRELDGIEAAIGAANATRPEPYTHLLPSLIPQSINI